LRQCHSTSLEKVIVAMSPMSIGKFFRVTGWLLLDLDH